MRDIKESKSPPIPQAEFLQFLLSGYLGEVYYSSSMICSRPACKGDPDPPLLQPGKLCPFTQPQDIVDEFLSSSKRLACLVSSFFLISRSRELFRKTERSLAYFKPRFLARFKRDLAFTVRQLTFRCNFWKGSQTLCFRHFASC